MKQKKRLCLFARQSVDRRFRRAESALFPREYQTVVFCRGGEDAE